MNLRQAITDINSWSAPQGLQLNFIGSGSDFGAEGAKALADALKSGRAPQGLQLNLCFCNIGDEGAKALADALKSASAPQGLRLDLFGNNIGAEGANEIIEVIKSGHTKDGLEITGYFNIKEACRLEKEARANTELNNKTPAVQSSFYMKVICALDTKVAKYAAAALLALSIAAITIGTCGLAGIISMLPAFSLALAASGSALAGASVSIASIPPLARFFDKKKDNSNRGFDSSEGKRLINPI